MGFFQFLSILTGFFFHQLSLDRQLSPVAPKLTPPSAREQAAIDRVVARVSTRMASEQDADVTNLVSELMNAAQDEFFVQSGAAVMIDLSGNGTFEWQRTFAPNIRSMSSKTFKDWLFPIASVSKTVTATAAMMLVQGLNFWIVVLRRAQSLQTAS